MQRPDEEKRKTILRVARDLFSRRPFHEVRLDDIAAAAKVGKGTLYIYFASKDAIYLDLVIETYDELLTDLRAIAETENACGWAEIEDIVRRVTRWTLRHPAVSDIVRAGMHPSGADAMRQRRRALAELIERVLRRATDSGAIVDPTPEVTAQFIPAMARSVVTHGRKSLKADELSTRILDVLARGIRRAS